MTSRVQDQSSFNITSILYTSLIDTHTEQACSFLSICIFECHICGTGLITRPVLRNNQVSYQILYTMPKINISNKHIVKSQNRSTFSVTTKQTLPNTNNQFTSTQTINVIFSNIYSFSLLKARYSCNQKS